MTERVQDYERLGANAISIVTATSFQGEKEWIVEARKATKLPILRKDFITRIDDVTETQDLGADWILLIADLMNPKELDELVYYASYIGLKPVVEVNGLYGVAAARQSETGAILINNRNLRDGKVNILNTLNMLPLIPDRYEIMTASGYDQNPEVIKTIRKLGEIDWILIGKMLMQSTNLEETFKTINEP